MIDRARSSAATLSAAAVVLLAVSLVKVGGLAVGSTSGRVLGNTGVVAVSEWAELVELLVAGVAVVGVNE